MRGDPALKGFCLFMCTCESAGHHQVSCTVAVKAADAAPSEGKDQSESGEKLSHDMIRTIRCFQSSCDSNVQRL